MSMRIVVAVALGLSACSTKAPVESLKAFSSGEAPLTTTGVAAEEGGWRIEPTAAGSVRLFEVAGDTCEQCRLIYRAKLKAKDLAGAGFLEMWVRVPDKGEFFSRGLDQPVKGTVDWTSVEIPFFFQKGQKADLVKLNVGFQGAGGRLWIKDVELLKGPLP